MYPWISRTHYFWLQFCEKKCGLYMDVYGILFSVHNTYTGLIVAIVPCTHMVRVQGNYSVIGIHCIQRGYVA